MSSIPGNQYVDYGASGWRPGSLEPWAQNNRINPETGILEGDYGVVPWQLARLYQSQADRAVWQFQQRLMQQGQNQLRSATQFQQGALGLLQSYRAGGGAALEAGVYNNVANGMRAEASGSFNRAQSTQSLDYLSDLRRHENAVAQQRANRAAERQIAVDIIAGVSSQVQSASTGMINGGSAGGNGSGSSMSGNGGVPAESGSTASMGVASSTLSPEDTPPTSPLSTGGQQQQASPFAQSAQNAPGSAQQQQQGGQGMNTTTQPFGPVAGGGGPGAAPAGPGGGVGAGAGAGGGMQGAAAGGMSGTLGAPGADGNFSYDNFAAAAASAQIASPMAGLVRTDLNHYIADMYDRDPFYQTLPVAIERRWQERLGGAA